MNRLIHADNLEALPTLPAAFARLVYMDPPFNTGEVQRRRRVSDLAADGSGWAPTSRGAT